MGEKSLSYKKIKRKNIKRGERSTLQYSTRTKLSLELKYTKVPVGLEVSVRCQQKRKKSKYDLEHLKSFSIKNEI